MGRFATPVERAAIVEAIVGRSSSSALPSQREVDQDGQKLVEFWPTNSWTQGQRETLCLMKATYKNTDTEMAQIFSAMFAEHLRHQGFTNGLKQGSLLAQWSDLKKIGAKGHEIWRAIFVDRNFEDVRRDFVHLRNDVEDVARRLRIELVLSVDNREFVVRSPVRKKKKRTRDNIRNVLGDFSSGSDTDEGRYGPPRPISKRTKTMPDIRTPQRQKANTKALITPPASGRQHDPPRAFPPLLYRFADSNSQGVNEKSLIRAGLYVDGPSHNVEEEDFEDAAYTHLEPKPVSTPFISFFNSLRPSLQRALKSGAEDARVLVVDSSKIIQSYQRRYGTEDGAIFSAKGLILKYNFKLRGGYLATPEYLVWSSITEDAIVAVFTMKDLRAYVNRRTELRDVLQINEIVSATSGCFLGRKFRYPGHLSAYEIGAITGRFLDAMGFPVNYVEQAAIRFRIKWELRRANLKDYMKGVLDQCPAANSPTAAESYLKGQEEYDTDNDKGDYDIESLDLWPWPQLENPQGRHQSTPTPSMWSGWSAPSTTGHLERKSTSLANPNVVDLTHEDAFSDDDVSILGDTLEDIEALSIEVALGSESRSEPRTASPGGSPTTIFDDGDYVYVPDGIGHGG